MEDIWDRFRPKEGENDFMKNFAILIPKGPFIEYKPKPISRWKKVVCFLIGHKWGSAGVTWSGPGFPQKCKRCKKEKWFMNPNFRMRVTKWADKGLDKLWSPLCAIGIHRYKFHYASSSYLWMGFGGRVKKEQTYKCSCCKKIKTVNIK